MAKFKIKEFKKLENVISENFDSQVFALNKKYSRLKKVTEKYFENSYDISFDNVRQAFVAEKDPSMLMEKYKNWVNDYLKEVKSITDAHSYVKADSTFETDLASYEIDKTKKKIENIYRDKDKAFFYFTKKELVNEIAEYNKRHITEEEKKKRKKIVITKFKTLQEFTKKDKYLTLNSVERDLQRITTLIHTIENKEAFDHKLLNRLLALTLSIIGILGGIGLWLTLLII